MFSGAEPVYINPFNGPTEILKLLSYLIHIKLVCLLLTTFHVTKEN